MLLFACVRVSKAKLLELLFSTVSGYLKITQFVALSGTIMGLEGKTIIVIKIINCSEENMYCLGPVFNCSLGPGPRVGSCHGGGGGGDNS